MRIKPEYPNILKRQDLVYPKLSYEIVGAAFKVYNQLGWGHKESIYQKSFENELKKSGIKFEREKLVSVKYNNQEVGRGFLDFVVDGRIVVEFKVMPKFGYIHINQVVGYLKSINLPLAILIYFLKDGVKYR